MDFKKQLDWVSHKIILSEFSKYGIQGVALQWLRSFLTQFTNLNNIDSSIHSIDYVVPQGSILSPPLFLIYINYLLSKMLFLFQMRIIC